MYSSTQFSRLRVLNQANEQLQRLIRLKQDSETNQDHRQNEQMLQQVALQSSKTIYMFNQLIRTYSLLTSVLPTQRLDGLPYYSNSRSHSRTSAKTELREHQPTDDSSSVLMISYLSCTLSFLYTNFQNRLQDAAGILLRSKSQLEDFILETLNNSELLLRNQQSEQQSQVEPYMRKVTKISKPIVTSWNQFIAKNKCQLLTEYCKYNFPSIKSYIRISINLIINLILQKKYTYSVEVFNDLINFVKSIQNKKLVNQCLRFIFLIFFGSQDFQGMKFAGMNKLISSKDNFLSKHRKLTIEQAITVSHLIFNLDLMSQKYNSGQKILPQNFILLLEKSLETFLSNQLYEYAFFTLRHMLQSVTQKQKKRQYEYVLNELVINEKLAINLSLENIESVQCFRCIVETLISMIQKYQDQNKTQIKRQYLSETSKLFKLMLKIKIKLIVSDSLIPQTQKSFIIESFKQMSLETCPVIIQDLMSQQFIQKIKYELNSHLQIIIKFCIKPFQQAFKQLKSASSFKSRSCRIPLSQRFSNNNQLKQSFLLQKNKSQLKNISVSPSRSKRYLKLISTNAYSQAPSVNLPSTHRKQIFQIQKTNIVTEIELKRLNKMVRLCEYGTFLNKRNFNSDGGQFKFIKVTSTSIKWCKTAQKIDEQGQSYLLKDIKGILYGKITPNLKKGSNKSLKQQNCFSLVLKKRTMDFYCRDYNQVETWVCGLTQILSKQSHKIIGYTPGKMKWRKMFAILRQAYIEPLKTHQKNKYYFENAYSLILFKQNGYKLPVQK